jgi:hypothetical protein
MVLRSLSVFHRNGNLSLFSFAEEKQKSHTFAREFPLRPNFFAWRTA